MSNLRLKFASPVLFNKKCVLYNIYIYSKLRQIRKILPDYFCFNEIICNYFNKNA